MKVLFFYQHFWPDSPPYANMLRTICEDLASNNIQVTVLTAQPSYKTTDHGQKAKSHDVVDNVIIRRLPLLPGANRLKIIKLFNKAIWPFIAMLWVLYAAIKAKRYDVIVAATIPPVINGMCGLMAARLTGAKCIYHLQDIYPEIGAVGGLWSPNSVKHGLLKIVDSFVCKNSTRCVVLSQDMVSSVASRGVDGSSVVVINNFMLRDYSIPSQLTHGESTLNLPNYDGFRVVFAGNLGRFQGLELMLEAFLELVASKGVSLELHFLGEGAAEDTLRKLAKGSDNVFFHGHFPFESAKSMMSVFDAGIVSIQPDVYRYAFPSKTLTYLGLGLPMFAMVESESNLAEVVRKHQFGVSTPQTDVESIKLGFVALQEFLISPLNSKSRIRKIADQELSVENAMAKWRNLFWELEQAKDKSAKRNLR